MTTYQGIWTTNKYRPDDVYGDVWASIDFDNKRAKFILKYNGSFMRGTVKELETNIYSNGGQVVTYLFMPSGASEQKISFKATCTDVPFQRSINNTSRIDGVYTTENPMDTGTFNMVSKNFQYCDILAENTQRISPQYHRYTGGACNIM